MKKTISFEEHDTYEHTLEINIPDSLIRNFDRFEEDVKSNIENGNYFSKDDMLKDAEHRFGRGSAKITSDNRPMTSLSVDCVKPAVPVKQYRNVTPRPRKSTNYVKPHTTGMPTSLIEERTQAMRDRQERQSVQRRNAR